jgi:hypothetical protein
VARVMLRMAFAAALHLTNLTIRRGVHAIAPGFDLGLGFNGVQPDYLCAHARPRGHRNIATPTPGSLRGCSGHW